MTRCSMARRLGRLRHRVLEKCFRRPAGDPAELGDQVRLVREAALEGELSPRHRPGELPRAVRSGAAARPPSAAARSRRGSGRRSACGSSRARPRASRSGPDRASRAAAATPTRPRAEGCASASRGASVSSSSAKRASQSASASRSTRNGASRICSSGTVWSASSSSGAPMRARAASGSRLTCMPSERPGCSVVTCRSYSPPTKDVCRSPSISQCSSNVRMTTTSVPGPSRCRTGSGVAISKP